MVTNETCVQAFRGLSLMEELLRHWKAACVGSLPSELTLLFIISSRFDQPHLVARPVPTTHLSLSELIFSLQPHYKSPFPVCSLRRSLSSPPCCGSSLFTDKDERSVNQTFGFARNLFWATSYTTLRGGFTIHKLKRWFHNQLLNKEDAGRVVNFCRDMR